MVRIFTFLFTLFTLNSFAFAGLFLVGSNVFGGDPSVIITDPGEDVVYGVLYGNSSGTLYCCCPGGSRTCASANCSDTFCDG